MGAGAIAASAAGIVQAGVGAYQARKAGRRQKRALRNAYTTADQRMVEDQGYTRQGENESMNARGLVNGGQATGAPQTGTMGSMSSAPIPAAALGGGAGSRLAQAFASAPANTMTDPKAAQSARGQIGPANTVGGQESRDLSKQFLLERQDLRNQRDAGLAGVGQQQAAATSGAVTGGIGSGLSLYNAIAGMQAAQQAARPGPGAGLSSAFGIDPIDPLHNYDPTAANYGFNVARASHMD